MSQAPGEELPIVVEVHWNGLLTLSWYVRYSRVPRVFSSIREYGIGILWEVFDRTVGSLSM